MREVRILIIEDDKEIGKLVGRYLSKEGYCIDNAYDGREALHCLTARVYQMIILDLMIPQMDGYEVLRKIREKGNVPVLILSARAENSDKVLGLGLGADDYITKPFSMDELIARVKAQLRRYLYFSQVSAVENPVLTVGEIQMNTETYHLTITGSLISLTAKEFEILKLFMENPKRVFTKTQIFNAVWGEEYMSDENTVMVHIRRLREKIEPDPSHPKYLQTVWGIGYKLAEV